MAVHMALMLSGQNARSVWCDGVEPAEGADDFPRRADLLGLGRKRVART
jgi:hypothetical protein